VKVALRVILTVTAITAALTAYGKSDPRVHPHLAKLKESAATGSARVIISFIDNETIPQLPKLDGTRPASDPLNVARLAERRAIIDNLRERREIAYTEKVAGLVRIGATVEEKFWLIDGVVAVLPLNRLDDVLRRSDVTFIEESSTDIPPPNVRWGRTLLNSDWLYSSSSYRANYFPIGLLDTGVRTDHVQFTTDNRVTTWDCVNGTTNYCRNGVNLNPSDDVWNHGTSAAAILTGNNALGDDYRGVTLFAVSSYKVYSAAGLDRDAVVRGFQAAAADGMEFIAANMQDDTGIAGSTATSANNAYQSNIAVIAANGNFGSDANGHAIPGSVRSPALAQRVIGVGVVDAVNGQQESSQGLGPTSDGRTKPDIQAPTNVYAASNASTTATRYFTGTSAGTPFATAAAALLAHFQNGVGTSAGCYYARLINYGNNWNDPTTNNQTGAGLLVLPSSFGMNFWPSSVYMSGAAVVDITYTLDAARHDFKAAIWWAEGYAGQLHNQINLSVIDPSGVVVGQSVGSASVYQKVWAPGALAPGTWTVRLSCASCPSGARTFLDVNVQ
jgi:serine protease AprX